MKAHQFFRQVEYSEFRRMVNRDGDHVQRTGYETIIYDGSGDILGIVHAASIDERGRCHPTEYYLRRLEPGTANLSLVA